MGVRGESIRAYRMGIGCEATPVREQPVELIRACGMGIGCEATSVREQPTGEQGYRGLYGRLK